MDAVWMLAAVVLAVLALAFIFFVLPRVLVPPSTELSPSELLKARNDIRTVGVQLLGGALLLGGLFFTNRTLGVSRQTAELSRQTVELSREGQITERFTRAIEQLGSDKLDVRVGAIYALERVARDSKTDHGPVMEVLTAFVREHSPWPPNPKLVEAGLQAPEEPYSAKVRADIQAALTVIGRRAARNDSPGTRLDLSSTDLRGANLAGANLRKANLSEGNIQEANLQEAYLQEANIQRVDLYGSNLQDANLQDANLQDAYLRKVNLQDAYLQGADLRKATLWEADLQGAYLQKAYLQEANLQGANLQGANLHEAIGLTKTQVARALTNENTKLPADLPD